MIVTKPNETTTTTMAADEDESFLEIDTYEDDENDDDDDDDDNEGENATAATTTTIITADKTTKEINDDNNNKRDDNDNEDDDDDDDDNVIITINDEKLNESVRLAKLLRTNQLTGSIIDTTTTVSERDRVQRYIETDLELQREIEMIVRESIRPNTDKCISVSLNNQVILIPVNIRISDRLANYIWGPSRQYSPHLFPFVDEFNLLLQGLTETAEKRRIYSGVHAANEDLPSTFAVFAVRYVRTNCLAPPKIPRSQSSSSLRDIENIQLTMSTSTGTTVVTLPDRNNESSLSPPTKKHTTTIFGLYQYCDFSLIMIRDNRVIDYAIHGTHSNIAEVIERHQPEVVYYNAQPNDALDVFVNYEWQPFYTCLRNIARPVNIYRNNRELFNTLPFCLRCDTFCAFCHALRDTRSLIARPWRILSSPSSLSPFSSSSSSLSFSNDSFSFSPLLSSSSRNRRRSRRQNDDNDDDDRHDQDSAAVTTPILRCKQYSRYEPYRRAKKNTDWRHYARSRRPRRMQSNRFNYNSNCETFKFR